MAVIQLHSDNLKDTITKEKVLLLDFYADWCGDCRMMYPVIEEISEEVAGNAVVAKFDIEENIELAHEFEVQKIPTILVYKEGKETARFIEFADKEDILDALK
ncbi:MAG TPA: thioredoxin [Firmicutes bacterium]|nr:thioredoxin [Bacillota bacterium]